MPGRVKGQRTIAPWLWKLRSNLGSVAGAITQSPLYCSCAQVVLLAWFMTLHDAAVHAGHRLESPFADVLIVLPHQAAGPR